jgi:hypothetical protein
MVERPAATGALRLHIDDKKRRRPERRHELNNFVLERSP